MKSTENKLPRGWNITLWILQALLAFMFLFAGATKFMTPTAEQLAQMKWMSHVSPSLMHFIGVAEFLGAMGLLVPALLKIKPVLTPIAAIGLGIIMILAGGLNGYIGETQAIAPLLLFAAVCFFVAWGRFKKAVIQSK